MADHSHCTSYTPILTARFTLFSMCVETPIYKNREYDIKLVENFSLEPDWHKNIRRAPYIINSI